MKEYQTNQDIKNVLSLFNIRNKSSFLMKDLCKAILKTQRVKYDRNGNPIRGVSRSYLSSGLRSKSILLDLQINEALEHLKTML